MRDKLIDLLYGGLYDASPGSDRHREQCRRIQEATAMIIAREEETMAKKKKPPAPRPVDDKEEKPMSFRNKIIKKFHDDPEETTNGV